MSHLFTREGRPITNALYDAVERSWNATGKKMFEEAGVPFDENTTILNSMIGHCVGIALERGDVDISHVIKCLSLLADELTTAQGAKTQ